MSIPARKVIIDTDPGIDDAIAILLALASPEFDILALSTVAGNIGLDLTTRNALRLLALAGRTDIAVHAGAAAPLARPALSASAIHGAEGIGGIALPEPLAAPAAGAAHARIATMLDAHPPGSIDILALGPLTNLALLLREHPMAAKRLGRVISMGGAVDEPGNVSPRGEFNLVADPEAAALVLGAGLDFTLIPLDATRQLRATRDDAAELRGAAHPFAEAAGALIDAYFTGTNGRESRPLHDPCVMLLALRPDLFGIRMIQLAVNGASEPGALMRDIAGAPLRVAMTVKSAEALALLKARLRADY